MPEGPQNVGQPNSRMAIDVDHYMQTHGGERPKAQIVRCGKEFDLRTGQRVLWNRGGNHLTETLQRRWVRTFGENSLGTSEVKIRKAKRLLHLDAEHAFDKHINVMVKKLAYGEHDTAYIVKQLEELHEKSKVLIARSGGRSTPEKNVIRFRENLKDSLDLLKDTYPEKYRKVQAALQKASAELDHHYAVVDPHSAPIFDSLAKQGLVGDPEAEDFAQQLGRQIPFALADTDDTVSVVGAGIRADNVADGCHAEQLELAAAKRAELRDALDIGELKQFRSRELPQQRVHNEAAETLSAEIDADDADSVGQLEEPVAGQAGRRPDRHLKEYRPRQISEEHSQPIEVDASGGDDAVSEASSFSSTPLELNQLQLLTFNRHKVELAKLADDAGVDASKLKRMLADLTRTGVEDADELLYEVADLQERCLVKGLEHPEIPPALGRLLHFASTLEKDIREAIASGGKRETTPPPAAGQSEPANLNAMQLMRLQRHDETLGQIARVTGHDDVANLSDMLADLSWNSTRDDLNAVLQQVLDVKDRYVGGSTRYTALDEKAAGLPEKIHNVMGIIEKDIRAAMPNYDVNYDID